MPLVFVHGVNVRQGSLYDREIAFRNRHFAEIFYRQLGREVSDESIFNPYWGDLGATISPDRPFLPRGGYEMLWRRLHADGKESSEPIVALEEILESDSESPLLEIARNSSIEDVIDLVWDMVAEEIEEEGSPDGEKAAGAANPQHAPSDAASKQDVGSKSKEPKFHEGAEMKESENYMARMAQKALDFGHSLEGQKWLSSIKTDEELLEKFSSLLSKPEDSAKTDATKPTRNFRLPGLIKSAGGRFRNRLKDVRSRIASRSKTLRRRISEDISAARFRSRQLAVGTSSRIFNDPLRALFHQECALLIGDAFSYFSARGDNEKAAPIAQRVMDAMRQAAEMKEKEGGELIVVGHSMGGVILCDIVTCYGKDIPIDVLITVGSQYPLFADLHMFPGVDTTKRPVPKPENVKEWINIFDPNDFLGYPASHIFEGVRDYHLATYAIGGAAHTDYFNRRSFYFQLARRLTEFVSVHSK
jgi:hypothetical protein